MLNVNNFDYNLAQPLGAGFSALSVTLLSALEIGSYFTFTQIKSTTSHTIHVLNMSLWIRDGSACGTLC